MSEHAVTTEGNTPGPWAIFHWNTRCPAIAYVAAASSLRPYEGEVATVWTDGPDARLIAAAPDLLAALKRVMGGISEGTADTHEPGCRCVWHEARAAIAKAEGRS